jgi:uncharacterized protein (DUF1499 family)
MPVPRDVPDESIERMSQLVATFPTPFAAWSRRIALFSVQLAILGVVLHRLMSLPTPVTLNLFAAALVGAVIAVLLGLIAFAIIWRLGRAGAWSAAAGVLFGLALFAWPAAYMPFFIGLPALTDISTDPVAPPRFAATARQRGEGANSPTYAGATAAKQQQQAYPDIRPIVIPRSADDTFDAIVDTVRKLKWKMVAEDLPQGKGKPGYIEAVDRTLILGFYDDVVVRVDGDEQSARVDIRSASRYGRHDLGRNAARVRAFFQELESQLERSVGSVDRPKRKRKTPLDAVPKRQKGDPALSAGRPQRPARAQPDARRAQPPTSKQR